MEQNETAILVDCGHDNDLHPINDFGVYLPESSIQPAKPQIGLLVLTNYDHDHFSGLPNLHSSAHIKNILFPKNLSMQEIRSLKKDSTSALDTLEHIRNSYTGQVVGWTPPYKYEVFSLTQEELKTAGIPIQTNHLSQIIFIEYGGVTFCIPGDLEEKSWDLMLNKTNVQKWLFKTKILMASHHGRANGYNRRIFDFCKPFCIIFSDKEIVHGTQANMSDIYAQHVSGDGVSYTSTSGNVESRKVLTTRKDGHILITVPLNGVVTYCAHILSK